MSAQRSALLLIAHGSRRPEANAEVARLAGRLREAAAGRFDLVEHAFLEMAEPDVPAGLDACVRQGATRLWALPYFLAAGRHVRDDVPALVAQARRRHPGATIHLCAHLGAQAGLPELLLRLVEEPQAADPA